MKNFFQIIKHRYKLSGERSKETINSIVISLFTRVANIIAHLLVVPLTINYLNAERYGIWLTLSSIISWVNLLDFGLGNGFRNRFAEAKANGDVKLAKEYVSTTYCVLTIIVSVALVGLLIANKFVDWSNILGVGSLYKEELSFVFSVVIIFTCCNMVVNVICSLLNADQRNGYASIVQSIGQYASLFVIYILSKTTESSLSNLALYYSGIPCIVTLFASVIIFNTRRYRIYKPELASVNFVLTRNIMNLGVRFFIIQLCMIAVFQIVNIVVSRELGAEAVTQYNIANKYYNVVYMTLIIIITPFWSAFTDAYTKHDYIWMKSTYNKLNILVWPSLVVYFIMTMVSGTAFKIWVGDSVEIPFAVSAVMAVLVFMQSYSTINIYIINGMGKVYIQMIIYVFFALISWSALSLFSHFGLVGVILFLAFVYFIFAITSQMQIVKIINKKAKGIWLK